MCVSSFVADFHEAENFEKLVAQRMVLNRLSKSLHVFGYENGFASELNVVEKRRAV